MAKRTSEADEKITRDWREINRGWWERFMRKARNNSLLGPFIRDHNDHYPRVVRVIELKLEDKPVFEGPLDFVREYEQNPHPHIEPCRCNVVINTGTCVTCGRPLYKPFPKGFPEEWKMCCGCKLFATWMTQGENFTASFEGRERIERIRKLITLVG